VSLGNLIALIVAAVALLALPRVITHDFYINMASQCLIFAILALSLNLMLGFGGMVSLGHAAYIGIAGYTCILLTVAGYHPLLAALAGLRVALGGPMLTAYPGLDTDMLPLALIVVILGGAGSLLGAFVGSFIVGFIYNFGIALVPDLAYFVLFLPMVLVLVFLPQGLFGRVQL